MLFHEFEGGIAEWGECAFGAVEETAKELVDEGVDAVRGGGFLADEGATAAVEEVSPVMRARRDRRVFARPSRSRVSVLARRFSRVSLASWALTLTIR